MSNSPAAVRRRISATVRTMILLWHSDLIELHECVAHNTDQLCCLDYLLDTDAAQQQVADQFRVHRSRSAYKARLRAEYAADLADSRALEPTLPAPTLPAPTLPDPGRGLKTGKPRKEAE